MMSREASLGLMRAPRRVVAVLHTVLVAFTRPT